MEKIIKICCLAGLIASWLFVAACDEEQTPPTLEKQPLVVSKSIPDAHLSERAPGESGDDKEQSPPKHGIQPESAPAQKSPAPYDTHDAGDTGDIIEAGGLPKAGITTPMAEYDSRGRVDPFIPLIAEKSAASGVPSSGAKPQRPLTPLEKLELSQIKLVAVVQMSRQTIAMVEDATGKGYEVAVGTYIGSGGGKVTSITRNGIRIEKTVVDYQGKRLTQNQEIKFHKSEGDK